MTVGRERFFHCGSSIIGEARSTAARVCSGIRITTTCSWLDSVLVSSCFATMLTAGATWWPESDVAVVSRLLSTQ